MFCCSGNKKNTIGESKIINDAMWYFYQLNITPSHMTGYYYLDLNLVTTNLLTCGLNISSIDSTTFQDRVSICINFVFNENEVFVNYGEGVSKNNLKKFPEAGCFSLFEEEIVEMGAYADFKFDSLENRADFITLLKKNIQILHPWLKKEAKRRGFIQ